MATAPSTGANAEEQIMAMSFRYKIKVLGQVASPAAVPKTLRGPLIAIEGDDGKTVAQLGEWLNNELKKGDDLAVQLESEPDVTGSEKEEPMAQYHLLASKWLIKTKGIVATLTYKPAAIPTESAMADASSLKECPMPHRNINDDHDDSRERMSEETEDANLAQSAHMVSVGECTDLDKTPTTSKALAVQHSGIKPVILIANYSLRASNTFACRIPISPNDPYSPSDHWQWTATQWRGIVGPDLTIYIRDATVNESGRSTVEILEEGNVFVIKRAVADGDKNAKLDPSALRRLGFEVGEWVRAFGVEKRGSA
jgi:HMG box factor, other